MVINLMRFMLVFMLVCLGCQDQLHRNKDVLAVVGKESLTLADFDTFLLNHAQENRWTPQGDESKAWVEEKLRRLAVERLLTQSKDMQDMLASPEIKARILLWRFQQLNNVLHQEISQELIPSEEAVLAKVALMKETLTTEPTLNLQHIFFRTDRGDATAVKTRAEEVLQQAQAGQDFSQLVRQHSDSANAKEGGFIRNVHPSNLDKKVASILEGMQEGTVSGLIESRTGLHLFRLIRRLEAPIPEGSQFRARALATLQRETYPAFKQALLQDLHQRIPVNTEQEPWQIGSFSIAKSTREAVAQSFGLDIQQAKPKIVEMALLAQEAKERQLAPPQLEAQLERSSRLFAMQQLFNRSYGNLETLLPPARIKTYFDAQPSLFAQPEELQVSLIFVPQGRDSFATQKALEKKIATLRKGASFSQLAQDISQGPQAENGGQLGFQTLADYQHYGPQMANALAQMKVGDISDPIYCTDRILSQNPKLLRGGFAIVKVEDRKPAKERSFEQAIDDVRRAYAAQYRQDLDREIRDKLLSEADYKTLRLPSLKELVK